MLSKLLNFYSKIYSDVAGNEVIRNCKSIECKAQYYRGAIYNYFTDIVTASGSSFYICHSRNEFAVKSEFKFGGGGRPGSTPFPFVLTMISCSFVENRHDPSMFNEHFEESHYYSLAIDFPGDEGRFKATINNCEF